MGFLLPGYIFSSTEDIDGNKVQRAIEEATIVGDITIPDGKVLNLQESINFTGATSENLINFPDDLGVALDFREGSNSYLFFRTSNAQPEIIFNNLGGDIDFKVNVSGVVKAFFVEGSSGILTLAGQSSTRYYLSASQSISAGGPRKILLDTKSWDVQNEFASNKFTAKEAGKYIICGKSRIGLLDDGEYFDVYIYINGALSVFQKVYSPGANLYPVLGVVDEFDLAVNDYVELYARHDHGSNLNLLGGSDVTSLAVTKIA